jgi:hypothetical protein
MTPDIATAIAQIDPSTLTRRGSPKGLFGFYLRVGQIGIKCQSSLGDAEGEFAHLKTLEPTGLTPKPYMLKDLEIDGEWYHAIFMEHIEGTTLRRASGLTDHERKSREAEINTEANEVFSDFDIRHGDLHHENIIIQADGGYKVIDFTPSYIYVSGSEEGYTPSYDHGPPWSPELETLPPCRPDQLEFNLGDLRRAPRPIRLILVTWLDDCIVNMENQDTREGAKEALDYAESQKWIRGRHMYRYEIIEVPL